MVDRSGYVVGLDIGTTKICCVIGNITDEGIVDVLGVGTSPSVGVKRGIVNDIQATVSSILAAVEEAENVAGVEIDACNVGIAGGHIDSINSKGVVAISRSDKEITQKDIDRALDQARAVALPADKELLHTIPRGYTVDEQTGIDNPLGMTGTRLEVEVHIITGAVNIAQNVIKAVTNSGLKVSSLVLEPLASAKAVLTEDERDLGVVLVDIGGGTTDIAIFSEGTIRHSAIISVGGANVTRDISIGLRTPRDSAEQIKQHYAVALQSLIKSDDMIEIADAGGRDPGMVSMRKVAEIVGPRMEELLSLVGREISQRDEREILAAGIVYTGGGSKIKGIVELSEQLFNMTARVGYPVGVSGLSDAINDPIYATAVGLAMMGRSGEESFAEGGENESVIFKKILKNMKEWIENII